MHPVGSYCMDASQCTVNKTLNLNIITSLSFTEIQTLTLGAKVRKQLQ